MKKGLLVAVMIFAVVFGAFADTVVEPSVSGSATLTWGMDLDNGTTGFDFTSEGKIELTLVDEATAESTGEGTWGYIKLENYKVSASATEDGQFTVHPPTVAEAKIVLGDSGAYIKIVSQPGVTTNNAAVLSPVSSNIAIVSADVNANATVGALYGFTFGYDMDMVSLGIDVVSDDTWDNNANNDYAFGVDMTITPADMFKTEIAFNYGDLTAGDMGFSVKPTLTLADVMNGVEAWVAFDGSIPSGADFAFDVAFGTTLNFSEADGDDNKSNVALNVYYGDDLDVKLAFTELDGDDGAMAGLGAGLTVDLINLMSTLAWDVSANVSYSTGGITPKVTVGMDSTDAFDMCVEVAMGSDFTGIDNTDFTLKWDSGNLGAATAVLGDLTFATKISM